MDGNYCKIRLLLLSLLLSSAVIGQTPDSTSTFKGDTLMLSAIEEEDLLSLHPFFFVYPKEQPNLNFDEIRLPKHQDQFVAAIDNRQPLQHYWGKFTFTNDLDVPQEWFMEMSHIEFIDIYIIADDSTVEHRHNGLRTPFSDWDVPIPFGREQAYNLKANSGETYTIYINATLGRAAVNASPHRAAETISPKFLSDNYFNQVHRDTNYTQGIFLGIVLALILHNFIIFLADREPSYLALIIYLFSLLIFWLVFYYFAFEFFWPNSPNWNALSYPLSYTFIMGSFFVFTQIYLRTAKEYPRWHIAIYLLLAYYAFSTGLFLWNTAGITNYGAEIRAYLNRTMPITIVGWFVVVGISINSIRRGYSPAKYYLIANLLPIIGGIFMKLQDFGMFPQGFIVENGAQFGNACQAILFSLGLGDRYNLIRQELAAGKIEEARMREELKQAEVIKAQADEIIRTKEQLVNQEKLASLGALTAGIAHEIKNPLNFVNNFAALSIDSSKEIKALLENDSNDISDDTRNELLDLAADLEENSTLIKEHGTRVDGIVQSMSLHARPASESSEKVNINEMLQRYINLAYHGLRTEEATIEIDFMNQFDEAISPISLPSQNLGRVFLNILNNACQAVTDKATLAGDGFKPKISVTSSASEAEIIIKIRDNGNGLPDDIKAKIFEPFFTTKPAGSGTGLGLSIAHDIIVKELGGNITVDSSPGEWTEFEVKIRKTMTDDRSTVNGQRST